MVVEAFVTAWRRGGGLARVVVAAVVVDEERGEGWERCAGGGGCWVSVRSGEVSGGEVSRVTFRSGLALPDSHQPAQRGCVAHTSCQSLSILLGNALQAWVEGTGEGASCCT